MSDLDVRRVVIACDVQDEIELAVRQAATLAARWGVPVHGIFLQNENLRRLAGLPVGRPVSVAAPTASEGFDSSKLDQLFAALATGMRRALETAANEAGLDWSFTDLRDLPSAAAALLGEGDMLVVEAGGGGAGGAWRPRSHWEAVASELGPMVLLRRGAGAGRRRVVLVIAAATGDHGRIIEAARALAQPHDETTVLAVKGGKSETTLKSSLRSHAMRAAKVEPVADVAGIKKRVAALEPRLIIVETPAMQEDALRQLIAGTQCDLLLIG
jgi:hypothetical protein